MRKTIIAGLMAAVAVPGIANAQSAGEIRRDNRDVREQRQDLRDARRDGDRHDVRDARGDLRDAQQERREDWRDYRQAHGNDFRRGAYVGPAGFRYRPVTAGYRFAPSYYGSRYWINDYYRYRLPRPAYGLRYIRYGNDVVLINLRTGRVVSSYNSFFY